MLLHGERLLQNITLEVCSVRITTGRYTLRLHPVSAIPLGPLTSQSKPRAAVATGLASISGRRAVVRRNRKLIRHEQTPPPVMRFKRSGASVDM